MQSKRSGIPETWGGFGLHVRDGTKWAAESLLWRSLWNSLAPFQPVCDDLPATEIGGGGAW